MQLMLFCKLVTKQPLITWHNSSKKKKTTSEYSVFFCLAPLLINILFSLFSVSFSELNKNINDAIDFYSRAGRYNHAVRLAQNSGLDNDLMRLSVMSSKETMLSSARYFEAKGDMQSAVSLYQKSGAVTKALNLCFRAKLFDDLRQIADSIGNLGSQADPETLAKCAAFFVEHKQHDKAVHLYVMGGRIGDAIDMCLDQKVIITDDLAAKMTPAKPPKKGEKLPPGSATPLTKEKRVEILMKLARVCKKQGSYHLATKKYTQAGDKLKAMKCLLKSGDTEKIIFFANVSRNRDIYILAANYLQNLDWHNNPATMKSIITFYTKAKAFEQLSSFYDACANVEIDEYRDYAKALGALNEAERYLSKARNTPAATKQERLAVLQQRIILVERFVQARKLIKEDPSETVQICTQLLASGKQIDNAIRVGDVFALLIEYYYKINDYQKAFSLIEQMRGML
jgi:intraflagellar transport protein 140